MSASAMASARLGRLQGMWWVTTESCWKEIGEDLYSLYIENDLTYVTQRVQEGKLLTQLGTPDPPA